MGNPMAYTLGVKEKTLWPTTWAAAIRSSRGMHHHHGGDDDYAPVRLACEYCLLSLLAVLQPSTVHHLSSVEAHPLFSGRTAIYF